MFQPFLAPSPIEILAYLLCNSTYPCVLASLAVVTRYRLGNCMPLTIAFQFHQLSSKYVTCSLKLKISLRMLRQILALEGSETLLFESGIPYWKTNVMSCLLAIYRKISASQQRVVKSVPLTSLRHTCLVLLAVPRDWIMGLVMNSVFWPSSAAYGSSRDFVIAITCQMALLREVSSLVSSNRTSRSIDGGYRANTQKVR